MRTALLFILFVQTAMAQQPTIVRIAGSNRGFGGDGKLAEQASLAFPSSLALDSAGNLYIADTQNNRIRCVDTRIITTVAGSGRPSSQGDSGSATEAALDSPYGVALDEAGNLFIADSANNRIRMVLAATPHSGSLHILEAVYEKNRLTISGSGFGFAGASLSIDGRDITAPTTQSGVKIVLKGNRKKLGLKPGSNIVVTCNCVSSNTFIFK